MTVRGKAFSLTLLKFNTRKSGDFSAFCFDFFSLKRDGSISVRIEYYFVIKGLVIPVRLFDNAFPTFLGAAVIYLLE